jgi:DNA helicase-2/ATP-dependent DNA helicase PcrA
MKPLPKTNATAATNKQVPDPDFIGDDTSNLAAGMKVEHQRFGKGSVVQVDGAGDNRKATIEFEANGKKVLVLKFAKLKIQA